MPSLALFTWYAGAIALGALLGFMVGKLFQRLVPPGSSRSYWETVTQDIQGIIYGEDEAFWGHYKSTLAASGRYVGRQMLGLIAAFSPLVIVMFFLGPVLLKVWEREATRVVAPESAGSLISASTAGNPATPAVELRDGLQVTLATEPGSQVICKPGSLGCLVLQGFAFHAIVVDESSPVLDQSLVIVRGWRNDWNPLWPYLNDPEFLFFLSLTLFSVVFMTRKGKNAEKTDGQPAVEPLDFFMTQMAARNMPLMSRLGNWETRFKKRRLARIEIDRPLFIAGLARSGTTILLEKLAAARGVATHRYRDFPFVMTPVIWNRFLALFAARQQPVERPHKDSIKITRDSPDAFEEPIWQFFFPGVHDPNRLHILDDQVDNPEFAVFFREHLKKILLIRHGERYLSKGNYNLPRIPYLGKLFPDARFLVPVRHPLTHVYSLARQHQIFSEYARTDTKMAQYLEAVGHYEFGPQRKPICLTPDGGQQIMAAWNAGDDLLGYARQWADVYGFVLELSNRDSALAQRLRIVRFEDLCANPTQQFEDILSFAGLSGQAEASALAEGIKPPPAASQLSAPDSNRIWQVVQKTAVALGYRQDPVQLEVRGE